MIESFLALMAFIGFGIGDGEEPSKVALQAEPQQIIRAIDSIELQGLNNLEAHDADEWFV
jgi:hypothetical protein